MGLFIVGLVLTAALLAVPRAAPSLLFPVPLIDVHEASATRARFDELSSKAQQRPLPFETRAVGDGVRRLGVALSGAAGEVSHLRGVVRERVRIAIDAKQSGALLELRAVQARLFVEAVRSYEPQSEPSAELNALGGDFARRAVINGWLTSSGCVASDDELRTLFVVRWTELTDLRAQPGFLPSLGELRRYYRFLMLYPERRAGASLDTPERAGMRLQYVNALSKRDPDYPAALARGALLGQLELAPSSVEALRAHLAQRPGLWALRARNYLVQSLNDVVTEDFP